ncbi:MAG: LTA synthase family protein [Epsilonproteobacteria bacterium]|nr:LTA synthase family protein [Campylobacterota bacterium]
MQKNSQFQYLAHLISSSFRLLLIILFLMSLVRVYLLFSFGSSVVINNFAELLNVFWLGMRLDASILAYSFTPLLLIVVLVWLVNSERLSSLVFHFSRYYFAFLITLLFCMTFVDLAYFSYFAEHSTLMIFGVLDDDTTALINTALANYNVPLIIFSSALFLALLYVTIWKIIQGGQAIYFEWSKLKQGVFFLLLILAVGLLGRGSIGIFPLAKDIPDVSADPLLNKLPQTAVYALINSFEHYSKSKSGSYDLIKMSGYSGRIDEAFKIHMPNREINSTNLLASLERHTRHNEAVQQKQPHVLVVMMESFGLPLTAYQSESFNILGHLKRHFDEDTLFTNFISSSNGTIVSLEPLLLNITARPESTSFAQSEYLGTEFKQASARVYQDSGYETSFIYGGDLSWRNVGSFMSRQGFDNVEGKGKIATYLHKDLATISHDWGVFDEYLYEYVYEKLSHATKPQFIFILTTNNHPPYTIPKDYQSNSLELSKELRAHITGDIALAQERFKDYGYALDMAGVFLDRVKSSSLADKSVVAITADNNTIEGIMRYDDYYTETKKIPFYIYLPEYLKPKTSIDTTIAGSHKDIFPTLYNLTLSDVKYTSIGTNLLDSSLLHCGFNDAGVIMSNDGGFNKKEPKSKLQKSCVEYYNATLAVTEYLVKSHKKQKI